MTSPIFKLQYPQLSITGSSATFPVHRIYCVGQNYASHTLEMGGDPKRNTPFFFSKPADAACQQALLPWPTKTNNLHHEVELVVAMGQGGKSIFGYGVGVDLTRRDLQTEAKQAGRPWDTSKGFDFSAPISKLMTTKQWQPDAQKSISLSVNGITKQQATLAQLIWKIPELIKELSAFYTLAEGDLIFTGTPAGVSALAPGDMVHATIEGLPELTFNLENI